MNRILQVLFWLFGVIILIWSFLDPRFRDLEGFLEGIFCLPLSVGVSLIVIGCGFTSKLRSAAFWFALAMVGHAVALQLIDAGPFVRYQHYKPFTVMMLGTNVLFLVFIALQTALVFFEFRKIFNPIRTWVQNNFKFWQYSCIGLIFFITSATVSQNGYFYIKELFIAFFIQALNLANIILVVWKIPEANLNAFKDVLLNILDNSKGKKSKTNTSGQIDIYPFVLALWILAIAIILNIFFYERHPHIPDEVAYLYHAKYFSKGLLTMPPPPVPEAFNIDLMFYDTDRWFSPVPPGWPAILSIGTKLGVPWMVNPILAAGSIILSYIVLKDVFNVMTARIGTFLLAMSPWYIFMAMNFMTHTLSLFCTLTAIASIIWARKRVKALYGWVGGISIGILSLTRPLEGFVVAIMLGLWSIGLGGKRLKKSAITGLVIGTVIIGSLMLPYNKILTGSIFKFPIMAYTDKYFGPNTNAFGFGPDRGVGWAHDPLPGHGLLDALINANLNFFSVNIELYGWSIGSLLFLIILLFSGWMKKNDYLLFVFSIAVIGLHTFYWFSGGPDFGARYWYLILFPFVALTARGIQALEKTIDIVPNNRTHSTRVYAAVLSLSIITLANFIPWRAIDKYHQYRGMRPDIRSLAEQNNFGYSLVLIQGNRHPDYHSTAIYNPINLYDKVPVYAWDNNVQSRKKLLGVFSNRDIWIINGPSITKKGFKVVDGPLKPHEL
jgi:hypothetical protein